MATEGDTVMSDAPPLFAKEKREGSPMEQPVKKRRKPANESSLQELRRIGLDEMTEEEKARFREETRKELRLEHPWWYETDQPTSKPPDINYRRIIFGDQKRIDRLLANQNQHFEERCLRYQTCDMQLENRLLEEYLSWIHSMRNWPQQEDNEQRTTFFAELEQCVEEDRLSVRADVLNHCQQEAIWTHTNNLKSGGPQRFPHVSSGAWYYYDTDQRHWKLEPSEEGLFCEERRIQWRKEAMSQTEKRYYDSIKEIFLFSIKRRSSGRGKGLHSTKVTADFSSATKRDANGQRPNG